MESSMMHAGRLAGTMSSADRSMAGQIAAVYAAWAAGQARWTPVPADAAIGADLDFAASRARFLAARQRLAGDGVLVQDDRGRYYAA